MREFMTEKIDVQEDKIVDAIHDLITLCGCESKNLAADLTTQMIQTSLKLMIEEHDLGQLKLMNRALKEMRHAYKVFNQYPNARCISIFGSARTPENHPDYQAAKALSFAMAEEGWMGITGASDGIMKAGLEGTQRQGSFGLSIRLPFEIPTNPVFEGDSKLMMFRYFFTRKLMFMTHSDAVAAFPGGFGTLDELFEVLTLMHNGKTDIIPVVLVEGTAGVYWPRWKEYINTHLLGNGWISLDDPNLYYFASSPDDARKHILQFYRRYHSSRYVKEMLVLRMLSPLTQKQVDLLNEKFGKLVQTGTISQSQPLPGEIDFLELPRLVFHHTRRDFGLLRLLIDQMNEF
jgi:uncharacterized protein (TIGR00730 family)